MGIRGDSAYRKAVYAPPIETFGGTVMIRAVLAALGIEHSIVIGHDIGTMVAYAYASRYPQ